MLVFNDETLMWGMGYLNLMKHKRGFPELTSGIQAEARALLRIAQPVIVAAHWNWNIKGGTDSEFSPKPEMVNPGVQALEKAVVVDHPILGTVNPMAWIVDYALDNFQFFPAAVELRRVFQDKFPTADGQSAGPALMKGGA
jgi:hypothetical protein